MLDTTSRTAVRGHVEGGWGKVADAFRGNFEESPGEVGAACCIYVDGHLVVDLCGNLVDRQANRAWDDDTIAWVASTTKGATATLRWLGTGRSSALRARSGSPSWRR
jgi:CubicO group peptidase (beta-lactamase class C family)